MAKIKTSKKRKKSLVSISKFEVDQKLLLNRKVITEVLIESILDNDIEVFRDVLISHLRTLSKTELARKTGLGRRTLYDLMDEKKFDPRLSTLVSLLNKIAS